MESSKSLSFSGDGSRSMWYLVRTHKNFLGWKQVKPREHKPRTMKVIKLDSCESAFADSAYLSKRICCPRKGHRHGRPGHNGSKCRELDWLPIYELTSLYVLSMASWYAISVLIERERDQGVITQSELQSSCKNFMKGACNFNGILCSFAILFAQLASYVLFELFKRVQNHYEYLGETWQSLSEQELGRMARLCISRVLVDSTLFAKLQNTAAVSARSALRVTS